MRSTAEFGTTEDRFLVKRVDHEWTSGFRVTRTGALIFTLTERSSPVETDSGVGVIVGGADAAQAWPWCRMAVRPRRRKQ